MKNRLITTRFMLLITALTSPLAFAHPGHDHQHWSSSLIHLFWILPAMIAIGIAIHLCRRKRTVPSKH